jgi:hypothetical protein
MNQILSKEGKIAIRGAKVLDTSARNCCCQEVLEWAYKLANCCDESEFYWVNIRGLGADRITDVVTCWLFREERGCFRVVERSATTIERLTEQGIEVFDEPLGECIRQRPPEPGNPLCNNDDCPECDLLCCKVYSLPPCTLNDQTQVLRCNIGAKYRFQFVYEEFDKRWGAFGGEWCVTSVDTPPDAYCPSKCFHVYRDLISFRSEKVTTDAIIDFGPAPWGTPCLSKINYRMIYELQSQFRVFDSFDFTNKQDGMPTVDSEIRFINERLETYERTDITTEDDGPYESTAFGFTSPIWFCLSGYSNGFEVPECCNATRYFDATEGAPNPEQRISNTRWTVRSLLGCYNGYSNWSEVKVDTSCLGSLPPRIATGLVYREKYKAFSYTITPLPSDYCPTLENRRGDLIPDEYVPKGRVSGDPSPTFSNDLEVRKFQQGLTKGCHKCRSSLGL